MVPFVEASTIPVAGHPLPVFGPLIVFGLGVGIAVALHRSRVTRLDRGVTADVIWHAVIVGFVVSHVFDLVAYHPDRVVANPLELLKFWGAMSSFGGMIGGLFGMWICFARRGSALSTADRFAYIDTIAYGFPFAWIFGRLACTLVFDHPGTITRFPLATSLATEEARLFAARVYHEAGKIDSLPLHDDLVRYGIHNLGFYEFLYTACVIAPAFVLLGRTRRPPGFFLVAFFVVYSPIRFLLDFARLGDARYGGLTPAQYAAIAVFGAAIFIATRIQRLEA